MRTLVSALMLITAPVATSLPQSLIGKDGGAVNLGWANLADTSGVELTLRRWYGSYATGAHLDIAAGIDWGVKRHLLLDIMDIDAAEFIGFRPEPRTLVVLRGGVSYWMHNDRTDDGGLNVGLGVHHWFRAGRGLTVDMIWRQYSGYAEPSVTVGYAVVR